MVSYRSKKLLVIEANIDDMSPEWSGHLLERLFEEGALDVTFLPALMKKGRPASVLQVLTEKKLRDRLLRVVFEESTSLGARTYEVERFELSRQTRTVKTSYGPVEVKTGCDSSGHILNVSPEYESCKRLAKQKRVPLKAVYLGALQAIRLDRK